MRGSVYGCGFIGLLVCLAGCNTFTANSYNAEGVRMLACSRTEEALDCFEQARCADPNNPDAYYNCGVVYHKRAIETGRESDFQMAKYYYDLCLQKSPNHVECNRSKATLLCDMGQNDEAFKMMECWVHREPSNPEPRIELARLYDEHNQLTRARDCLNDAVAIDDRNVRAYTALGNVRERMGDRCEALSAYEHALALNPYQPDISSRVAALRYATPATTPPSAPLRPEQQNSADPNGQERIATQPESIVK
ncbi:MAG: tetratricopeptide repeat protein [Planctomycetia bacterium]|nr:tetratricopeptide repeat protein [Planctomycetia bacterium]